HDGKADAPSGTARSTAEMLTRARGTWPERGDSEELVAGSRGATVDGVHVHSLRLPGLMAHQEVIFGTTGQTLTIRHDSIDRTVLAGGSGPVITQALADHGLVPEWQARLAHSTFGVYDRLGESRLTMELTRRVVSRSKGWERAAVEKAAGDAAEVLERRVL